MAWIREMYVRFAVIRKVAQAYMLIGLDTGTISNEEAREFMVDLQHHGRRHNLVDVSVSCIVEFGVAISSENEGRAESLAERFEELALFGDLIVS